MQITQRKDHPAVRDPSSKFLNSFWDLASDDGCVRRPACVYIIEHLERQKNTKNDFEKNPKKDNGISVSTKDGQDALKRLIRGLGSSRQSARLGFASCLCEILKRIEDEHIDEYWNILNESTQVTGSLKGSEERDLLFGKLFGYSALIRSKKLINHKELAMKTLDGLLDLFKKKEWFQEVVAEVIFDLLYEFDDNAIIETVIPLLAPLFPEKLENMSPNQLLFTAGIERLFKDNDNSCCFSMFIPGPLQPKICYSLPVPFLVHSCPSMAPTSIAAAYAHASTISLPLVSFCAPYCAFPFVADRQRTGRWDCLPIHKRINVDNAAGVTFQTKMCADSKLLGMIDIRWNWVQELQDSKEVKAVKIATDRNIADLLTKCHSRKTYEHLIGLALEKAKEYASMAVGSNLAI